jgi:hypothetical protein
VNIIRRRQDPAGSVWLTGFNFIFLFPCNNMTKFIDELFTVNNVIPDSKICAYGEIRDPEIKKRKIICIKEKRDSLFFSLIK